MRVFANIDNQPGRIGNNLGIRAYADTSGELGLKEWQKISGLPLSGGGRNYIATLYSDVNDESTALVGRPKSNDFDQIFIGGEVANRLPNQSIPSSNKGGLLYGEGGADILTGGIGSDVLVGGDRFDQLTGGGGSDTFVFSAQDQGNPDFIRDFSILDGDKIGLAQGLTYNELRFTNFNGSTFIGKTSSNTDFALVEGLSPDVVSGDCIEFCVSDLESNQLRRRSHHGTKEERTEPRR